MGIPCKPARIARALTWAHEAKDVIQPLPGNLTDPAIAWLVQAMLDSRA